MTGPRVTDRCKRRKNKTRRCIGLHPHTGEQCNAKVYNGLYDDYRMCVYCRGRIEDDGEEY